MARGGVLDRFHRPGGRGFELSFFPGGWELTDTSEEATNDLSRIPF